MTSNRIFTSVLITLTITLGGTSSRLSAQADSDTAAVARALADVVAQEATRPGDHEGPFILDGPMGSEWLPRVAAVLRSRHPEVVTSSRAHVLHLSVDDVRITGDSAQAVLSWSLCTTHRRPLNFWDHVITYVFVRSPTTWRFLRTDYGQVGDGSC
jgi:hypothetical protein